MSCFHLHSSGINLQIYVLVIKYPLTCVTFTDNLREGGKYRIVNNKYLYMYSVLTTWQVSTIDHK